MFSGSIEQEINDWRLEEFRQGRNGYLAYTIGGMWMESCEANLDADEKEEN